MLIMLVARPCHPTVYFIVLESAIKIKSEPWKICSVVAAAAPVRAVRAAAAAAVAVVGRRRLRQRTRA